MTADWDLVAGSLLWAGTADGCGRHARFRALKAPSVGESPFLYVRDQPGGIGTPPSRLVRVDLRTGEACTMGIEGLDIASGEYLTMVPRGEELFVVKSDPAVDGEDWGVQVLRGRVVPRMPAPTLVRDLRGLDLAAGPGPVVFRLAGDGGVFRVDRRILVARSAYFRALLASGSQADEEVAHDVEVDLRGEADVGPAEFGDLLRFLLTDALEPADEGLEHMFRVRSLASRYQLPDLEAHVDARLIAGLSSRNLLPCLGRAFGNGGALERECWRLLEARGRDILDDNADVLVQLAQESPELAKEIMLRAGDFGGTRKRRRTA